MRFVIYGNIDAFDPGVGQPQEPSRDSSIYRKHQRGGRPLEERSLLDRWILSELHQTTSLVRQRLDAYDIFGAAGHLSALAESLSNWYLQRSRERFWRAWKTTERTAPEDLDKFDAYWTLYECLLTLARLTAPFVPFMAEELWQNLARKPLGERAAESVHLTDYPSSDPKAVDLELAEEVGLLREIVSLGRNVRAAQKLKTRLPLSKLVVVLADDAHIAVVRKHEGVLQDALNVKSVGYARQAETYVTYELKPNFKRIGAKYRELVPALKAALAQANAAHIKNKLALDGYCVVTVEGKQVTLSAEEVEVSLAARPGYAAAGSRQCVVVLDTAMTPELLEEGFARELVSRIQKLRGEMNLKYEQRIRLAVKGTEKLESVARKFEAYLKRETLATDLYLGELPAEAQIFEVVVEGEPGSLGVAI